MHARLFEWEQDDDAQNQMEYALEIFTALFEGCEEDKAERLLDECDAVGIDIEKEYWKRHETRR